MLYDKSVALQVLGSLVKKPALFMEDKYDLQDFDFDDRFHKIVFSAIKNLFYQGTEVISAVEIDLYLSNFVAQKQIFDSNNGISYVESLIKFAKVENFDYYYLQLKKYTLLRQLDAQGFDTTCYIDNNLVDPKKIDEMMCKFNKLTVNDILVDIEKRVINLKDKFYKGVDESEQHISDGLSKLIESLKETPEIGVPLNGNILNTICRGTRLKKLYLDSRPSGYYKTRAKLADCARISIPFYYNTESNKWENTHYNEPTLFITTELEVDEIQTMLVAYVSGVNESKILDGRFTIDEEERVKRAVGYIQESNMYIVHLPNYTTSDVVRTIKKYALIYNVGYVYFDYLFITPRLLQEISSQSRGVSLRPDMVLLNIITVLKDLCNELDIFLSTSTQVSDGWQETKHPDSSLIRGAKSLADKADIAYIGLPPSKEELTLIKPILDKGMYREPNIVYHVYKVRRGTYNKVKLFMYFDAGTCRTEELFATNNNCEYLEINGTNIEKILDDTSVPIEQIESESNIEEQEDIEEQNSSDVPW